MRAEAKPRRPAVASATPPNRDNPFRLGGAPVGRESAVEPSRPEGKPASPDLTKT